MQSQSFRRWRPLPYYLFAFITAAACGEAQFYSSPAPQYLDQRIVSGGADATSGGSSGQQSQPSLANNTAETSAAPAASDARSGAADTDPRGKGGDSSKNGDGKNGGHGDNDKDRTPGTIPQRYEAEFSAARIETTNLTLEGDQGVAEQTLTLTESVRTYNFFNQTSRPVFQDNFTQGYPSAKIEEEFRIAESGVLDLLVVMDNSGSMANKQEQVATRMEALLSAIQNTDWQIGVVTTDSSCLRGTLTKGAPNTKEKFRQLVLAGTGGSNNERGILMATQGLDGVCLGKANPWRRSGASFAVLFVTDEDNCSKRMFPGQINQFQQDCPFNDYAHASYLKKELDRRKTSREMKDYGVYGLFWSPEDKECDIHANPTSNIGYTYKDLIDLVAKSGSQAHAYGSICAADYTSILQKISQNINSIVAQQFRTKFAPIDSSVVLQIIDSNGMVRALSTDYTLQDNLITVNSPVNPSERIRVAYAYKSSPKKLRLMLTHRPDPASVEVIINGQALSPAEFTLSAEDAEIKLAEEAPEQAQISVRYRLESKLNKIFTLSNPALAQTLEVKVGNVLTRAFKYRDDTHQIEFDAPPADGKDIEISFLKPGDRRLRYPVMVPQGYVINGAKAIYSDSKRPINFTIEDQELVINEADFVVGHYITVTYNITKTNADLSLDLNPNTLYETIIISSDANCQGNLEEGTRRLLIECKGNKAAPINVAYNYVVSWINTYKLENIANPNQLSWYVYVNGQKIQNFERQGATIKIPDHLLLPGAIVRIVALSG